MAFAVKALCLFLVAVVCIHLSTGVAIQLRCQCIKYSEKASPWKAIEEFSITQPHGRCQTTEVIITLKGINTATGRNHQRCLDLKLNQTITLQECWNRINKDESRPKLKYSECGQRK
ncbi:C-X-C motif chemokine 11 [Astyanax mexicanus]|uniref:C-X-C motif chemokine 11 n=1 Tax=Astyanax mexicanus TaxID=7994 RepID=UPI000BBD55C0|nr:C-X-C motif chemokine 11 [Astyanax mexicanus]